MHLAVWHCSFGSFWASCACQAGPSFARAHSSAAPSKTQPTTLPVISRSAATLTCFCPASHVSTSKLAAPRLRSLFFSLPQGRGIFLGRNCEIATGWPEQEKCRKKILRAAKASNRAASRPLSLLLVPSCFAWLTRIPILPTIRHSRLLPPYTSTATSLFPLQHV